MNTALIDFAEAPYQAVADIGSTKYTLLSNGYYVLAVEGDLGVGRSERHSASLIRIATSVVMMQPTTAGSVPLARLKEWAGPPPLTDAEMQKYVCRECNGEGEIECEHCGHADRCDECDGEGYLLPKDKTLGTGRIVGVHIDRRKLAGILRCIEGESVSIGQCLLEQGRVLFLCGAGWWAVLMQMDIGTADPFEFDEFSISEAQT